MDGFTPIQSAFLRTLADGRQHARIELKLSVDDPGMSNEQVYRHVNALRQKLRPKGEDIVCVHRGWEEAAYQHVRLLKHDNG